MCTNESTEERTVPYTTFTMMVNGIRHLEIEVSQSKWRSIVKLGVYPAFADVWLSRLQLETLYSTIGAYLHECDLSDKYDESNPVKVTAICK